MHFLCRAMQCLCFRVQFFFSYTFEFKNERVQSIGTYIMRRWYCGSVHFLIIYTLENSVLCWLLFKKGRRKNHLKCTGFDPTTPPTHNNTKKNNGLLRSQLERISESKNPPLLIQFCCSTTKYLFHGCPVLLLLLLVVSVIWSFHRSCQIRRHVRQINKLLIASYTAISAVKGLSWHGPIYLVGPNFNYKIQKRIKECGHTCLVVALFWFL